MFSLVLLFPGGPQLCRDKVDGPPVEEMASHTDVTLNISSTSYIEALICGYPKPTKVSWFLGDYPLNGSQSSVSIAGYKGRYRYKAALPVVEPSMCGKVVRFVAKKDGNAMLMHGQTKLNVICKYAHYDNPYAQ